MPYHFIEPRLHPDPDIGSRPNLARPDVYTAQALPPEATREAAGTILQAHAQGKSWSSPTRYAAGRTARWNINREFRSSKNLAPELPCLSEAYAALDAQAIEAFPWLGLDTQRTMLRRVSDQCILYGPGDHLSDHADDSDSYEAEDGSMVWQVIKPQRHLVGVLWLTTQTDDGEGELRFSGGELRFNSLVDADTGEALVVRPAAGRLVIFPASAWFRHEVLPVRNGMRLTVTRWWEVVARKDSAGVH